MAVTDPKPRLVVTGPAELLHMSYEHGGGVTVFRVVRHEGTAADCRLGPQRNGDVIAVGGGVLYVAENEAVCATASQPVLLSWHVRGHVDHAPDGIRQASLP